MHALNKFIHSFAIIRKKKKFVQSVLGTAYLKNVLRITKVSYCFALGNVNGLEKVHIVPERFKCSFARSLA